jgi:transcriptional regulator with XRE-family HTH domain
VSLIQNGRANPTLLILEDLAKALGVDVPELLLLPPKTKRSKDKQS